jgi:alkanesulfonate monooxygenase SsuD/methylene tetrahydromethanopterin reductase-like flavin-dependent oxidoreductase (luciferase family)
MKIGLIPVNVGYASAGQIVGVAQAAEAAGLESYPLPVQKPFPVIVGGSKGKVYERIARHGDGWYAPCEGAAELAPMLAELRAVCAREGRDCGELEITAMWRAGLGIDMIRRMQDIGVHRMIARVMPGTKYDTREVIAKLGDEVIARL